MNELLDSGHRHRADLRPAVLRPTSQEPSIALLAENLYVVLSTTLTMGFVERVGSVYVALSGPDLGRAVEVAQTRSWDRAVDAVRVAFPGN